MRTLVLNAGYEPLAVVSFRRAVVLVLAGKASVLAVDDVPVRTGTTTIDRPSVILLKRYVRVPFGRSVPVSRRGVLRRDGQRCAYCGRGAGTVDHVVQTVGLAGTTREAVRTVAEPVVAPVREVAPVAGGTVDRVVGGLLGGR